MAFRNRMAHRFRLRLHNKDCDYNTSSLNEHEMSADDVTIARGAWGSVQSQSHNEQVKQDMNINTVPNNEVQHQGAIRVAHAQEPQSPHAVNYDTMHTYQNYPGNTSQQHGTSALLSSHNHTESRTYFSRHYARSFSQRTCPTAFRQPDLTDGSLSSIANEANMPLAPRRRMGICDANDRAHQLRRRMRVYQKRF